MSLVKTVNDKLKNTAVVKSIDLDFISTENEILRLQIQSKEKSRYLVGTAAGELSLFNSASSTSIPVSSFPQKEVSNIRGIEKDKKGRFWISTT